MASSTAAAKSPPEPVKTGANPAPAEAEPLPQGPFARFWHFIRPILILVIVLFAVRSSVADWNDVPTGSMIPTILEGDRIFVNKMAYDLKIPFTTKHIFTWGDPKRGDICVFFSPEPEGTRLVKRCVGVPGDVISVRENKLTINGVPLDYKPLDPSKFKYLPARDKSDMAYFTETIGDHVHAIREGDGIHLLQGQMVYHNQFADFPPNQNGITIPPGKYFMMGDNRDNSKDSRYFTSTGRQNGPPIFVDRSQIVGRASAVAVSIDLNHYWIPRWSRFFSSLP